MLIHEAVINRMLLDRFIRLLVVRFTYAALPFTDHILFIETSYDQAVLTTTKDGPVENLHIRIDVTDLFTGRETPIFDLSGPLLMLSRGITLKKHWLPRICCAQ